MKTIKLLFLFLSVTLFAQSKVGTVDVDFILSKMPELPAVQAEVQNFGKGLDEDLNKKYASYNVLIDAYKAAETTFTPEMKLQKQQEITTAEDEIKKFQQNGSKMVALRRDEALRPLYAKIGTAMEKIAKAEKYTQILQITNDLVYIDPDYDLTVKILKELGIEYTPE